MSTASVSPVADRPSPPAQIGMLIVLVAIPLVVGALGSLATTSNVDGWYADADKAPWAPPNEAFGPVWTSLYLLMGVASWLVWRRRDRPGARTALFAYVVQLVLNSLWTPVFFAGFPLWGPTALWLGFVIIVALAVAILTTLLLMSRVNKLAAALLVPYLLWVLYASSLNLYLAMSA